jgi:hypothetical protein
MTAERSVSVREGTTSRQIGTMEAGATKQQKMEDANILYVEGTSIEGCPGTMTGYGEL